MSMLAGRGWGGRMGREQWRFGTAQQNLSEIRTVSVKRKGQWLTEIGYIEGD